MWFSYDGESFQTHNTEAEAIAEAKDAMEEWSDRASDGWDEQSTQVMCGLVTHMVRVEHIEVTNENQHLVPSGCEGLEEHFFERYVGDIAGQLKEWLMSQISEESKVIAQFQNPLDIAVHRKAYWRRQAFQQVLVRLDTYLQGVQANGK